jgi:hypothetical protein
MLLAPYKSYPAVRETLGEGKEYVRIERNGEDKILTGERWASYMEWN